ncbi:MAG: helix-turn-helix domain-containing protein [Bdellovibrionota bacterium]
MTPSDPVNTPSRLGMPNHYLTLDILPGASQNEIHHAYKRAKMTYSAGSLAAYSLLEDENNENIIREIEIAYETLSNPAHRREYDLKMGFNTWTEEQNAKEEARSYSRPSVTSVESSDDGDPFGEIKYATQVSPRPSQSVSSNTSAAKAEEARRLHVRVVKPENNDDFRFVANPDFESKIDTCSNIDGAFLRAVRIYKQVSLEQLSSKSKISPSKINAIEEEDLAAVYTQSVYLRGHVSIICRSLGIPNAEDLSRKFADRMRDEGKIARSTL